MLIIELSHNFNIVFFRSVGLTSLSASLSGAVKSLALHCCALYGGNAGDATKVGTKISSRGK